MNVSSKHTLPRSKSALRSTPPFRSLLPHEPSIQYLETSSQKKDSQRPSPNKKAFTIDSSVGIFIRIRPCLKHEISLNSSGVIRTPSLSTLQIINPEHQNLRQWDFHEIFPENSTQSVVFQKTCLPLLDNVIQGYNASMFVYGQTGTGKTYTMGLLDKIYERSEGLVPSSLKYLFKYFENYNKNNWEISMSFYQIYLDEIHDLLNPHEGRNLNIREDNGSGEPYIKDLTIVTLENINQAFQLINAGLSFRNMEATKHNETSSRSHVILTLHIIQKKPSINEIIFSKANFIDLAGSERVIKGTYKSNDRRFDETKFINLSLSTLGTIIASLNEKGKNDVISSHVAYRNSKLTRVLQSSLNGEAKIFLIATISPLKDHVNESISTCVFAARCKDLKVRPSLQSIGMDGFSEEIPQLVEYYEGMLENQKAHIKVLEEELRNVRSSQSNMAINENLQDFNEYLCKLVISLKSHVFNEINEIQKIRNKDDIDLISNVLLEELDAKYPIITNEAYKEIKEFPMYDDFEGMLSYLQGISKEIVQGINEMSKGCKELESLKQQVVKEKPINRENDAIYRVIAYLLKYASFGGEKQITLEKEAEGIEKIRKFNEKIEGYLARMYGNGSRICIETMKKVENYVKLQDPLSLEGNDQKDPLIRTLGVLRKYSNNSFGVPWNENESNDKKEEKLDGSKKINEKNNKNNINLNIKNEKFMLNDSKLLKNDFNHEFIDKDEKLNNEKSVKNLKNSKNLNEINNLNNSEKHEDITNNNNKLLLNHIDNSKNVGVMITNNKDIDNGKFSNSNDIVSLNHIINNETIPSNKISVEKHQNNDNVINTQDSKRSLSSINGYHKSLKDLTISKKQQRLLVESNNNAKNSEFQPKTEEPVHTTPHPQSKSHIKSSFVSDLLPKEQKAAYNQDISIPKERNKLFGSSEGGQRQGKGSVSFHLPHNEKEQNIQSEPKETTFTNIYIDNDTKVHTENNILQDKNMMESYQIPSNSQGFQVFVNNKKPEEPKEHTDLKYFPNFSYNNTQETPTNKAHNNKINENNALKEPEGTKKNEKNHKIEGFSNFNNNLEPHKNYNDKNDHILFSKVETNEIPSHNMKESISNHTQELKIIDSPSKNGKNKFKNLLISLPLKRVYLIA